MRAVMTASSLFPNRGGRGSRIRTCDLKYPKLPRYQTALYPETLLNQLVSPGFSGSSVARPKKDQKGAKRSLFGGSGPKVPNQVPNGEAPVIMAEQRRQGSRSARRLGEQSAGQSAGGSLAFSQRIAGTARSPKEHGNGIEAHQLSVRAARPSPDLPLDPVGGRR